MSQVLNIKQGLKTKDLCTNKSVMTINVTHWDPGHLFFGVSCEVYHQLLSITLVSTIAHAASAWHPFYTF